MLVTWKVHVKLTYVHNKRLFERIPYFSDAVTYRLLGKFFANRTLCTYDICMTSVYVSHGEINIFDTNIYFLKDTVCCALGKELLRLPLLKFDYHNLTLCKDVGIGLYNMYSRYLNVCNCIHLSQRIAYNYYMHVHISTILKVFTTNLCVLCQMYCVVDARMFTCLWLYTNT